MHMFCCVKCEERNITVCCTFLALSFELWLWEWLKKTNPWLAVSPTDVTHVVSLNVVGLTLLAVLPLNVTISTALWFEQTDSISDHTAWFMVYHGLSAAELSHPSTLILHFLRFCLNVSLNCSFCPPCVRLPSWSSPQNNTFGILLSSILVTCQACPAMLYGDKHTSMLVSSHRWRISSWPVIEHVDDTCERFPVVVRADGNRARSHIA